MKYGFGSNGPEVWTDSQRARPYKLATVWNAVCIAPCHKILPLVNGWQ